jgi:DNA topoisomerase VI subunit B
MKPTKIPEPKVGDVDEEGYELWSDGKPKKPVKNNEPKFTAEQKWKIMKVHGLAVNKTWNEEQKDIEVAKFLDYLLKFQKKNPQSILSMDSPDEKATLFKVYWKRLVPQD